MIFKKSNSDDPLYVNGANPEIVDSIPLIPLTCTSKETIDQSFNEKDYHTNNKFIKLTDVIKDTNNSSGDGTSNDGNKTTVDTDPITIVFAIRRPSCGVCREHAIQLVQLVRKDTNIRCIGIVKEVHEHGLYDLYHHFFYKYPIYLDYDWNIYKKGFGNRTVPLRTQLFNLPKVLLRLKRKGVPTSLFGGDHYTSGGILIFDKNGTLKYTYYEVYSELFDIKSIRNVINEIRSQSS